MFICLSSAGKKEATAGRQGHGGRRGPGHLKISPNPSVLGRGASFWRGGWGQCCPPPVRADIICQVRTEGWGRWCFLHGVWAWAPLLRDTTECTLLGVGGWGIHQVPPRKSGAQGRCTHWAFIICKSLCCGWEDLQHRVCLLGESG